MCSTAAEATTSRVPFINIEADIGDKSTRCVSSGEMVPKATCRRCKTMLFHCSHCQQRCHKKCPGHARQRHRCSAFTNHSLVSGCGQRICPGDEHWTKVLQANDVLGKLAVCPYHGRKLPLHRSLNGDVIKPGQGHAEVSDGPCRLRRSSSAAVAAADDAGAEAKDRTMLSTLFDRFCQWISDTRRDSSLLLRLPLSKSSRSRRTSSTHERDSVADDAAFVGRSRRTRRHPFHSPSSSSSSSLADIDDPGMRNGTGSRATSTCSSMTGTSTSTVCSDVIANTGNGTDSLHDIDAYRRISTARSINGVNTYSCVLDKVASQRGCSSKDDCGPLVATWPTLHGDCSSTVPGVELQYLDAENPCHVDVHPINDEHRRPGDGHQLRESLLDWHIPYNDLQLNDRLKTGLRCTVYSGRWHGNVLIHAYSNRTDGEVLEFLSDVANLSRIRHESVCLFMGASLQPPSYAIVTSELKGCSLYKRLHLSAEKLPLRSRVSIARQVAQALGYLHAKSISARCLSSRNIYLEPKVKLSVLDHGIADTSCSRLNSLNLPRGTVSYLAPEVLRTLRPVAYRTMAAVFAFNEQTDAFAFGTLLYELVSGEFPWRTHGPEEIIWQVVNGERQSLANLGCNSVLKILIEKCWMHKAEDRPDFTEINQELQNKTGLHKRHSSSQPARLDRFGSGSSRTFCIK